MLFSVIVPVFGVEKYLRQCIDSILGQTFTAFELILVDDGSTDNCPAICDEYAAKDKRINVIHKENGGATSARKAGIEVAQGEYILFIDSDDSIDSNLLLLIDNIVSKYYCDIVCFGYDTFPRVTKKTEIFKYRTGIYDKEQIETEIFPSLITGENGDRFPPSIWGKAFKRELVAPIQNDLSEEIILGEDSCVSYVTIYQAKSIYISHDKLYNYCVGNESLTRSKKTFSWQEPIMRAEFYLKYMPESQFGEQVARITAHSIFNVAISVLRVKKFWIAKKEILTNLSKEEIQSVLRIAKFKDNWKEKLALSCLRKKRILFMKILSMVL